MRRRSWEFLGFVLQSVPPEVFHNLLHDLQNKIFLGVGQIIPLPVSLGVDQGRDQQVVIHLFRGNGLRMGMHELRGFILVSGEQPLIQSDVWIQRRPVPKEHIEEP
jgi:hypothetical protein